MKLVTFNDGCTVAIGFDSSNKECIDGDFIDYDGCSYSYYYDGVLFIKNTVYEATNIDIKQGDLIKMEINVPKKTLKYFINDRKEAIGFDNIDIDKNECYFVVMLNGTNCTLQLLDFNTKTINK